MDTTEIKEMLGVTMDSVEQLGDDELIFTNGGRQYIFYHLQDCCEDVHIEDIVGDLSDLVGSPILQAEEVTEYGGNPEGTWTFYKFATIKGSVTVRWLGQSNGYYSERVDFEVR